MHKALKFCTMAALVSTAACAKAPEKDGFDRLQDELAAGTRISAILRLDQCEQTEGTSIGKRGIVGRLDVTSFLSSAEPRPAIAFSDTHFTVTPDNALTAELIRYRVTDDDMAVISTARFSPKTMEPTGENRSFRCKLGEGLSFVYAQ